MVRLILIFLSASLFSCSSNDTNSVDSVNDEAVTDSIISDHPDTIEEELFISAQGGYQIRFPGKTVHHEEFIPFEDGGDITISMDIYSPSEEVIYAVKYVNYPEEAFAGQNDDFGYEVIGNALETTKQQYGLDSALVEEERTHNNHIAYYYQAGNDQYFVTLLYTLVGNNLYQVVLSTETGFPDQATIDEFFNSFQLIES